MNSLIIAANVIRRLLRELNVLGLLLVFPLLGGVLAVTMFGKTAVTDIGVTDIGDENHALIQVIEHLDRYKVQLVDEDEIEGMVRNNEIAIGVILRRASTSDADKPGSSKVRILTMKEDTNVLALKSIIEGYLSGMDNSSSEGTSGIGDGSMDKPRMAMGFLTMFIIMFVGASMRTILEDKKSKTFMRVFCAPLKEYEMVLGNLLANLLLGIIQISLFLLVSRLILNISWGTSLINLFIILCAFLITAIGLGVGLIGIINTGAVFSVANTIVATLTCMLGGAFFSTGMMSGILAKISNFMPQKWAMEAFEKTVSGGTLRDIGINLLILLLFGAVFFTFGVKVMKPSPQDM